MPETTATKKTTTKTAAPKKPAAKKAAPKKPAAKKAAPKPAAEKTVETKLTVKDRVLKLRDEAIEGLNKIQKTIDEQTEKVQSAHQDLAKKSFEAAEKVDALKTASQKVQETHDNVSEKVYDFIRKTNKNVTDFQTELLGKIAS